VDQWGNGPTKAKRGTLKGKLVYKTWSTKSLGSRKGQRSWEKKKKKGEPTPKPTQNDLLGLVQTKKKRLREEKGSFFSSKSFFGRGKSRRGEEGGGGGNSGG